MSDDTAPLVVLGAVSAPFGVKGWVKVRSDTDPPGRLFEYRNLRLVLHGSATSLAIEATGRSGGQLTVKFKGIDDRDRAAALAGSSLCVARSDLPAGGEREFYRADLIGCAVVSTGGAPLGVLDHFVETPAHALMVVRGEKEYWIPAVPAHLRRVDLPARLVVVDWDEAAE